MATVEEIQQELEGDERKQAWCARLRTLMAHTQPDTALAARMIAAFGAGAVKAFFASLKAEEAGRLRERAAKLEQEATTLEQEEDVELVSAP